MEPKFGRALQNTAGGGMLARADGLRRARSVDRAAWSGHDGDRLHEPSRNQIPLCIPFRNGLAGWLGCARGSWTVGPLAGIRRRAHIGSDLHAGITHLRMCRLVPHLHPSITFPVCCGGRALAPHPPSRSVGERGAKGMRSDVGAGGLANRGGRKRSPWDRRGDDSSCPIFPARAKVRAPSGILARSTEARLVFATK